MWCDSVYNKGCDQTASNRAERGLTSFVGEAPKPRVLKNPSRLRRNLSSLVPYHPILGLTRGPVWQNMFSSMCFATWTANIGANFEANFSGRPGCPKLAPKLAPKFAPKLAPTLGLPFRTKSTDTTRQWPPRKRSSPPHTTVQKGTATNYNKRSSHREQNAPKQSHVHSPRINVVIKKMQNPVSLLTVTSIL